MTISNLPPPDELADVRAKIKAFEQRETELRQILLANPDLREGAAWLAEVKTVRVERIDIREMRACHPDTVAEFSHFLDVTRVVLSGVTEDGELVSARKMRKAE
jgi:hypothetical protein